MPGPDTHDLNALAGAMYFIVGRATEGGSNPYHLSIAGVTIQGAEPSWGDINKVAVNSGYSLGTIQVDLGQRGTWPVGATEYAPLQPGQVAYVDALISEVTGYAKEHKLEFPSDTARLRAQLLTHGDGKRHRGTLEFIDPVVRDTFNAWAGSGQGQSWIHRNIDFPQIRNATRLALDVLDSEGRNIPEDRRLATIAVLTKTANQRPANLEDFRDVLSRGGNYQDVLAKSHEIASHHRGYAAPKAATAADRFLAAYGQLNTAAALDRAVAKVGEVRFNPATGAVDPDIQKAMSSVGLASAIGLLRLGSHGDEVLDLQTDLARLGVTDAHGRALHPDGTFGTKTQAAVRTFQQTHGLTTDGIAGTETLNALRDATRRQVVNLADASHPGNPMYCQALEGIHAIDARYGRAPDAFSANLAGSLAAAAHVQGLARIDHVMLGEGATRAFAVQGDPRSPFRRVAVVDVMQAVATPLDQSSTEFLAGSRPDWMQQAQSAQLPPSPVQVPLDSVQR